MIIAVAAVSCSTRTDRSVKTSNEFEILPLPQDSSVFYFVTKPTLQDTSQSALDTFVNAWYSKMLFALKEPIISNYKGDKEIYRFTWLRTFHHPVSIRLEKQDNIIKLFSKISSGAGGYEPGHLIMDTSFNVAEDDYRSLINKLEEANFWNIPTEKRDNNGEDGSEWIIEAIKDNKYHMATRWTPTKDYEKSFRKVGEYLINISKITIDERKYAF